MLYWMLHIDKFNETWKPKNTGGKNDKRGISTNNVTNIKWAKGTKEGDMGDRVPK